MLNCRYRKVSTGSNPVSSAKLAKQEDVERHLFCFIDNATNSFVGIGYKNKKFSAKRILALSSLQGRPRQRLERRHGADSVCVVANPVSSAKVENPSQTGMDFFFCEDTCVTYPPNPLSVKGALLRSIGQVNIHQPLSIRTSLSSEWCSCGGIV